MVEAVVSFATQRLGHLLIQEASFLNRVHGQVDRLQKELRRMQCFLQDAEAKQVTDELVRNWVVEVRYVAYDSEDVIDAFVLKVAVKQREGFCGVLESWVCIFNKWVHLHKVGMEIQSILTRIQDISTSRITYSIANVGEASIFLIEKEKLQKQLRDPYIHIEDSIHIEDEDEDAIGLEDHIQTLVSELIKEEQRRRDRVVSIVGVGGLGKTTLTKEVASHADPWSLHLEPRFLTIDQSWELLCKKAFPKNMTGMNCFVAYFKKLGKEMVKKCGGLPLGVEFLYLGFFPEDSDISRKKLVHFWVAEGFIKQQPKGEVTMEDVREQQLAELTQRCSLRLK